ncbi:MAG: hypothetical protein RL033_3934 [Pseudomonadota bacterium]|jgi:uncharacterized membrane protein YphA (DoxX/SURF4 family)
MTTTTITAPLSGSFPRAARYVATGARYALGLVFFAAGLTGLLNLIPPPSTPLPAAAEALGAAMYGTGYLFPLLKGTEALAGALLLANCFVPLALTVLAPVLINIVAFHAFLTPGDVGMPIALLAAELYLAWVYRSAYQGLFVRRATAAV